MMKCDIKHRFESQIGVQIEVINMVESEINIILRTMFI